MKSISIVLATTLVAGALSTAAIAADTITIQVGYGAGGGYDGRARLVADHLGKYLPGNPDIVVENIPGSGSFKLTTLLAGKGPTDGSVIGVVASSISQAPIFKPNNKTFDPTDFGWIAALRNSPSHCYVMKEAGIETFEELIASDIKFGASGKGSATYLYPALIKNVFGAKFDIVTGYDGGAEINLAAQRGEIQGRCGFTIASLERENMMDKVNVLVTLGSNSSDKMPDLPMIGDLIADPVDRAAAEYVFSVLGVYMPMILPPNTSDEIIETYREATRLMFMDEAFVADAAARNLEIGFTDGATVQSIVNAMGDIDAVTAARVAEVVR